MNIWEILILSFAIHVLFTAIVVVSTRKGDRKSKLIWVVFLILFAYNLFYNVLFWTRFNEYLFRRLTYVYLVPLSLYGPLFYLYIKRLVLKKDVFNQGKLVVHLIPAFIVLLNCGRFYMLPLTDRVVFWKQGTLFKFFFINPTHLEFGLSILLVIYAISTYIMNRKSYVQDDEMRLWLKITSYFFMGFALSWLVYDILSFSDVLTDKHDYIITISMIIFVGLITYFGYIHTEIFEGKSLKKLIPLTKYNRSGLSDILSREYKVKIWDEVKNKELFLNGDLSLSDLSDALGMARHHTSQVINEHFGKGFHDFINEFRVEEAKKLLLGNDDLKIIEIAFMVGFNNKMSFHRAFKKITNMTPTKYIQQSTLHHSNSNYVTDNQ
ncbi:helix-turn-helix domain-containing protein [uncultured Allomuricauda sp.]|uniref:helix-turn-helix domain-containing protein n=1 Tax=Flagellimonas sp. W118 TaxID=3410791 RepID=UPI002610C3D4|nr:helix-turn-helix domain-containing protein [uncultured Allomuricauda sp.]